MRHHVAVIAVAVAMAMVWASSSSRAATTTAYSFEAPPTNPDGFGPNGGGITVTQDSIGATDGASSMKVDIVAGATFVGALTSVIHPSIGDPPGLDYILFDVNLPTAYAGTGFQLIGVTVFGASQPGPGQQFGLQAQFADFEHTGNKAAGQHNDIRIDLTSATHPLTFETGKSFNEIFGTVGSGPNDIIPTGFQLFFNKSNDAPMTAYIDNVRAGIIPEPASVLAGGAIVGGLVLGRRRRELRVRRALPW
jgi:hypothetical protein